MECPIIPLSCKIVILPKEEGEQMYGNIIVPDAGQEKPEMGTVLAVGPGRVSTDGTLIPNKIECIVKRIAEPIPKNKILFTNLLFVSKFKIIFLLYIQYLISR